MTTPTPEQLRVLANRIEGHHSWNDEAEAADALRAAADQLEAAAALTADVEDQRDYWADRLAAIERVADMAEDDEDGNGWVRIEPLLDALYPEKRGVSIE